VPGLGERQEDIPMLVHFLKKYSIAYGKPLQGLTRRAHIALLQHDWPGNVRELENSIAGAAITASAELIDISDFPEHLQKAHRRSASASAPWTPLPLDEVRSDHIQRVLDMCHGNRVRTAQVLGIGRTSLYLFLKRAPKHAAAKGAA
jgi:DNA-binding NtrC family response regulator